MVISKLVLGALLIPVFCLPFWATGRKIMKGLSRRLLWALSIVSVCIAITVLKEDKGGFATILVVLLLAVFAVYAAWVAKSLRSQK